MKPLLFLLAIFCARSVFAQSAYYCDAIRGAPYNQYIAMGEGAITVGPMHQDALRFDATLESQTPESAIYLGDANSEKMRVVLPVAFLSLADEGVVQFQTAAKGKLYAEFQCHLKSW